MAQIRFADGSRISQAYILSARDVEESFAAARQIAAAAVCSRGVDVPCGVCRACRKAAAGTHPDIVTVERLTGENGRQKREIGVDQIRSISQDAHILPNEAPRKVYILKEAETMNVSAQNAALKLLEEPPAGAVFLLCVSNAEPLLTTVRSRCAELKLGGELVSADPETVKLARSFFRTVAAGDRAKLFAWCAGNEDMELRAAAEFIECAGDLAADMLCLRENSYGMSREELMRLHRLLLRCGEHLRVNTGVKHIFGLLAVDSISGSRNRREEID